MNRADQPRLAEIIEAQVDAAIATYEERYGPQQDPGPDFYATVRRVYQRLANSPPPPMGGGA